MNHLVKFEIFESTGRTQLQTPKSQYLPKLGEVDPKKIASLNGKKDARISPEDRIKISNDSKNWFEKITHQPAHNASERIWNEIKAIL